MFCLWAQERTSVPSKIGNDVHLAHVVNGVSKARTLAIV